MVIEDRRDSWKRARNKMSMQMFVELLNTIGKSVKRGEEIQGDVIDKSFSQIEAGVGTGVETAKQRLK